MKARQLSENPYAMGTSVEASQAAGSLPPNKPVGTRFVLASWVAIVFAALAALISCLVVYHHITGSGGWAMWRHWPAYHWSLIVLGLCSCITLVYSAVQWRRRRVWRAGITSVAAVTVLFGAPRVLFHLLM